MSTLNLMCKSDEDLEVVSALMQDALVRARDLTFDRESSRFVGLFNRFRWELQRDGNETGQDASKDASYEDVVAGSEADVLAKGNQRVHAALCIEHVTGVRSKNFPNQDPEAFLNLLSILGGETSTTLLFADRVSVQVQHKRRALFLEDLGEAWPTSWQPAHNETSQAAS